MFDLANLLLTERDGTPVREGLHGLFGPVSGEEAARGSTQARLVYLVNNDPSPVGVMNLVLSVEGAPEVSLCVDQRTRPTNAPPRDAVWSDGLRLSRLRRGQRVAIWLRRAVPPRAPMHELVPFALALECDVV